MLDVPVPAILASVGLTTAGFAESGAGMGCVIEAASAAVAAAFAIAVVFAAVLVEAATTVVVVAVSFAMVSIGVGAVAFIVAVPALQMSGIPALLPSQMQMMTSCVPGSRVL